MKTIVLLQVDRSIIGGIVVDIEDKHIDLSIDTKIKQMEKLLAELVWMGRLLPTEALFHSTSAHHLTTAGICLT